MFIKGQGTSKDLGIITIYSKYSSLTRKKETRKKNKANNEFNFYYVGCTERLVLT